MRTMQNQYERQCAEKEQRDYQDQSDQEEIDAIPRRIFSAGIDRDRGWPGQRFRRWLDLHFGERMIRGRQLVWVPSCPSVGPDTPFDFAQGRLCPPPLTLIARCINAYWDQNISKAKSRSKS